MALEYSGNFKKVVFIRLAIICIGLGMWWFTQSLIGTRVLPSEGVVVSSKVMTQGDALLTMTEPLNTWLNNNLETTKILLVLSSGIIDVLGIGLLFYAIFGSSMRPFIGLLCIFSLRQLAQGLCALPPPENMLWFDPGFPSLLVTYGVANDFFFSGHTGLAVYAASELWRFKHMSFKILAGMIAIFEIIVVLLLRAHYTMDVFTGIVVAIAVVMCVGRLSDFLDNKIKAVVS